MTYYERLRAKVASRLNGFLMARFGLKVVRSFSNDYRVKKVGRKGGISFVRVERPGSSQPLEIGLREGTSDWLTFEQIFLDEDYNLRPLTRYVELKSYYDAISARHTPLILDLGANIGLSSLYFSSFWPGSQIVAVEPDKGNFAMLQSNSGSRRIHSLNAGAASREARLRISDAAAGKNAFTTRFADDREEGIASVTVGNILTDFSRAEGFIPFLIKIDIEGAEEELFHDNLDWIDEFPIIVIELHDWLYPGRRTTRPFLNAIADRNRDFIYLDENVFSIKNDLRLADIGVTASGVAVAAS